MNRVKKRAFVGNGCVACGVCVKACPLGAVSVYKGLRATVNGEKCVGCGKCAAACPAGVIEIARGEPVCV
jgi:Fe-S-cluster-containing hydrogenase component 2